VTSPILAPVSLSVWSSAAVFGVAAAIRMSISASIGMKAGSVDSCLYWGLVHVLPIDFKKLSYMMTMLSFVLVCHLTRVSSSLTCSGSVMSHCLSMHFSLSMLVAIVPCALPFFFMFHAWLRISPK